MAAPQQVDPFGHAGPWSEAEVLALPGDQRVELLDGSLVVSPFAGYRHQWLGLRLCEVLNAGAPAGARALGPVNVRVGPDRLLIPDVAVIERPTKSTVVGDAGSVLLVVEIVSPGNAVMDRVVKPGLYAEAGIPWFLRVELGTGAPTGHLHELRAGRYVETAAGSRITLDAPWSVVLDLAAMDDLED